MRVAELWRYPVKSLAGERLDGIAVTAAGMAGDRIVQVRNGRDRVITSRTAPRLLALRGTWDAMAGEPLVNASTLTAAPGTRAPEVEVDSAELAIGWPDGARTTCTWTAAAPAVTTTT